MKNIWNETLELLKKDSSYSSMFHMMERFENDIAAEMTDKNGKEVKRTYREYIDMSKSVCDNLRSRTVGAVSKSSATGAVSKSSAAGAASKSSAVGIDVSSANSENGAVSASGKMIGLIYDTCMDWPVLMWGILMSGNNPLLLNPLMDAASLRAIMKEADAYAYVSDKPVEGSDAEFIPAAELLDFERPGKNEKPGADGKTIRTGTSGHPAGIANQAEEKWGQYVALCTSGTTGSSRIFLYDSQTIANHMLSFDEAKRVHPDMPFIENKPCKLLAFLPFHHVFGFSVVYILYSCTGKTLVYMKDKAVSTILGTCRNHGVTHLYCIPMFFNALAGGIAKQLGDRDIHKLSFLTKQIIKKKTLGTKIRSMITGGGHVPQSTLDVINSVGYPLCNGFGMTETGIIAVERSLDAAQRIKGSIGTPFTLTEWRIDGGNDTEGELLIRGGALYTASIINGQIVARDTSAWFRTGDVVRNTSDGLYITGRCKDVIIGASGENIYPEEIEDSFSGISGVKNFCLMGLNNGQYEDVVLVAETDASADRNAVLEAVRAVNEKLPSAHRAVRICFSQKALPLSGSMKIKRQVLRSEIESGAWECDMADVYKKASANLSSPETDASAPVSETRGASVSEASSASPASYDSSFAQDERYKEILAGIKAKLSEELSIDIEKISDDDHYVEVLGADSLDMYEIFSTTAAQYGIEIPEEDMLKLETCAKTADYVFRKLYGGK